MVPALESNKNNNTYSTNGYNDILYMLIQYVRVYMYSTYAIISRGSSKNKALDYDTSAVVYMKEEAVLWEHECSHAESVHSRAI